MEIDYNHCAAFLRENALIVSSVIGSFISAPFSELKGPKSLAFSVFSSAALAHLFGKWLSEFFGLDAQTAGGLIGIFGLVVCSALILNLRKFSKEADFAGLFKEIIRARFGVKKDEAEEKVEG